MHQFGIEGIKSVERSTHISFTLNDNALFSGTGFKVLRNQRGGSFLPCTKSSYNGKVKLTYFTQGKTALGEYARTLSADGCRVVLKRLVAAVLAVRDNGFLSLRNIAFSPDKVFVDAGSGDVQLVYIPVSISVSGQSDIQAVRSVFSLCASVFDLLESDQSFAGVLGTGAYETGDLETLPALLDDTSLYQAKAQIPASTKEGRAAHAASAAAPIPPLRARTAYSLLPLGSNGTLTFRITQPRTIVGKHEEKADFVIRTSPAVSRTHCMLLVDDAGVLSVTDLGSVNGTYVNGRRLQKGEQTPLLVGARLRLADVEFSVQEAR